MYTMIHIISVHVLVLAYAIDQQYIQMCLLLIIVVPNWGQ